jgi:hypothetical protein
MLHAQPFSSFSTWSCLIIFGEEYVYEAPHLAVFSSLLKHFVFTQWKDWRMLLQMQPA